MARRLFEGPLQSSFQACLYVPPQGWARWLPTARFDEHRLSKNTMGLACALGEQRKLPSPPILYFAEPSSTGAVRFHISLKQWIHHPAVRPSARTRTDQADPSHSGVRIGRARETNRPHRPHL